MLGFAKNAASGYGQILALEGSRVGRINGLVRDRGRGQIQPTSYQRPVHIDSITWGDFFNNIFTVVRVLLGRPVKFLILRKSE